MNSRLTRPVEPPCYGSDQTFGFFWRHNFNTLMAQAQAVEKDYNKLLIQVRSLESEVSRLERELANRG